MKFNFLRTCVEVNPGDLVYNIDSHHLLRVGHKGRIPRSKRILNGEFLIESCRERKFSLTKTYSSGSNFIKVQIDIATIATARATFARFQVRKRMPEIKRIASILKRFVCKNWQKFICLNPEVDQEKFKKILYGSFRTALRIIGYKLVDAKFTLESISQQPL